MGSRTTRVLAAAAAAAALTAFAWASSAATASVRGQSAPAVAGPPPITISPLNGTPDASPKTQISFLGAPAADLSDVLVEGSRSGRHRGRIAPYSDGDGGSFLPARPFLSGETVRVSAVERDGSERRRIGTTFAVAHQIAIPIDQFAAYPAIAGAVLSLRSRPDLDPPTVSVDVPTSDPGLGDVFLTPAFGDSRNGPMIVTPSGGLVWFAPEPAGYQAADLRLQRYLGQPVLTYWQGRIALGHGEGDGVIRAANYVPIATVRAGNGLVMDMHDFTLGPGGVAYITVYDPVAANLSSIGGPVHAAIEDSVVQEIDVRTGLVMWEWHAFGHVPLRDSYSPVPTPTSTGSVYDYFHINSIQLLGSGNLVINGRNTWTTYELDRRGAILWEVGGRQSTFTLGPGVQFAYEHDATLLRGDELQIFDNEGLPAIGSQSRGVLIHLDFADDTATLTHSYVDNDDVTLTASQGDVQALPDGDRLLGYGQTGLVAQFTERGKLDFEMTLPEWVQSYRAYRFPWSATPGATRPAAVASRAAGSAQASVAVSWDGATTVARWQLLAGATPSGLQTVGMPVADTGFETQFEADSTAPYVAVRALGAGGRTLATSPAVAVSPAAA